MDAAEPRWRIQPIPLLFEDEHRVELIRPDLIEADPDAQLQCRPEVYSAPDEEAGLRGLRGIQPVERAVITPAPVIRRIRTQTRIAQLLPPQAQ